MTPTRDPSCAVGPVDTTGGLVCGTTAAAAGSTVNAFLGIKFGETTGGANRWQPPTPKARQTSLIQAVQLGAICPQAPPDFPAPPLNEDCLSINVWTPAGAAPDATLPTLVFIYGGSFLDGSSAIPIYDGAYIAASQNAVVVNFNYRLGALGFLAGIDGVNGNFGLLDQQLALQWVQDNIATFGGDPDHVMLFGESAGAMSVGLHLLSMPESSALFSAALMESNPLAVPYKNLTQAAQFATQLAKLLNCETGGVECMRALPAQQIVDKQEDKSLVLAGLLSGFQGLLVWAPVVDGTVVTTQPIAAAEADGLPKPTLIGTNRDEGTLFVYSALKELGLTTVTTAQYETLVAALVGQSNVAAILAAYPSVPTDNAPVLAEVATDYIFFCSSQYAAAQGDATTFAYLFTQLTNFNIWPDVPQCATQVCHADEVAYVFNTATNIRQSFTPDEEALSLAMVSYWAGFAEPDHDPNNGGTTTRPTWPAFPGRNYLVLDTPISTVTDPDHNCPLWDGIGYEVVSGTLLLEGGSL